MGDMGFNFRIPQRWNALWLLLWMVCFASLIGLSFVVPFWPHWLLASIPLFWIPELIGIAREDDGLPPLTHTIRHFLPNWLAFPLIYLLVGTIGATWLGFNRPWHLGALFGVLGWLTDHFSVTYARDDPFPKKGAGVTAKDLAESVDPRPRAF
jgi:hypothetical protein